MAKPINSPDYAQIEGTECERIEFDNNIGAKSVIDAFLTQKVGRKVKVEFPSSITELYKYYQSTNLLWSILVTYSDETKVNLISAERVS